MKIKNAKYISLILIVSMGCLYSCKQKKQTVRTLLPVEQKENEQLFVDILSKQVPFHTFSSKINLSLNSGSASRSSGARIRIVEDSAMQISIQPLFGIEMFRLHVDTDTLVFLDRMNKRFVKESISEMKQIYPAGFDLKTLQSLFCNRIFVAGNSKVSPDDYDKFQYSDTQNMYYLKSNDAASGIDYFFSINGNDNVAFTNLMAADNQYSLQWSYSNFALLQSKAFPYKIDITAQGTSRMIKMDISYSNIVLDQPMQLEMKIPGGYTQASLRDILKTLTSN